MKDRKGSKRQRGEAFNSEVDNTESEPPKKTNCSVDRRIKLAEQDKLTEFEVMPPLDLNGFPPLDELKPSRDHSDDLIPPMNTMSLESRQLFVSFRNVTDTKQVSNATSQEVAHKTGQELAHNQTQGSAKSEPEFPLTEPELPLTPRLLALNAETLTPPRLSHLPTDFIGLSLFNAPHTSQSSTTVLDTLLSTHTHEKSVLVSTMKSGQS